MIEQKKKNKITFNASFEILFFAPLININMTIRYKNTILLKTVFCGYLF